MAKTKEVKEVVITPDTPLDPAPKENEGVEINEDIVEKLGTVAGTLPQPQLTHEIDNQGQKTDVLVNQNPKKKYQIIKDLLTHELKVVDYIQVYDKNSIVDRYGKAIIEGGGSGNYFEKGEDGSLNLEGANINNIRNINASGDAINIKSTDASQDFTIDLYNSGSGEYADIKLSKTKGNTLKQLTFALLNDLIDIDVQTTNENKQTLYSDIADISDDGSVDFINGAKSSVVPRNNNDLVNKEYVDELIFSLSNSDSQVYVSTDKGTTYSGPITPLAWASAIENEVYSVGTIFKITKVFNGKEMRFIAIGLNHDVLSNTDLGEREPNGETAKMTLQCYDMPFGKVNLGLPFETAKTGHLRMSEGSDVSIDNCREFSIDANVPSNTHGYATAVGLRQMEQAFYDGLAPWLQALIKVVRKDIFISEVSDNRWNYEHFDSTSTTIVFEGDRYGSQVDCKVFSLSATEVGIIPNPSNNGKDPFAYTCPYDNGEGVQNIHLEGKKYEYFNTTYAYTNEPSTDLRRPRYWKGSLYNYWLRSPSLVSSYYWGRVGGRGYVNGGCYIYLVSGVAPAFCI